MKNVKGKILGRKVLSFILTATLVLGLMPGNMMTVSAEGTDTVISDELIVESVSSNDASATTECTCGTDDPAFHATNCPAYIAPENPQCYCAEKCTEDTLNVWCDVCGMQGVNACQGEDIAVTYAAPEPYDGVPVTPQKITSSNYRTFGLTESNWEQYNGYYAIRNAKELYGFAEIINDYNLPNYTKAVLLSDIVVNETVSESGATYSWTPIGGDVYFSGEFDGNGHFISGLYCNTPDENDVGLFGHAGVAIIRNVTLENSYLCGNKRVGGIVGLLSSATLTNCKVDSDVTIVATSSDEAVNVGGMFGRADIVSAGHGMCNFTNCTSLATVKALNVHKRESGYYAANMGAFCGYADYEYCEQTAGTNCFYVSNSVTGADGTSDRGAGLDDVINERLATITIDNNGEITDTHTCVSATHSRIEPTCVTAGLTEYSYCIICGEITSGTKTVLPTIPHEYSDATCTVLATCVICGGTTGTTSPHTYSNATCLTLPTCTVCGHQEGELNSDNHETVETHYEVSESNSRMHDKVYNCCGAIILSESHTISNGSCTVCGWVCQHLSVSNGKCDDCGVEGSVAYVNRYWNGSSVVTNYSLSPAVPVSIDSNTSTLTAGWYIVEGEVTNNNRLNVSGEVNIILADGCTLNLSNGIGISENDSTLNIYGQLQGTGTLKVTGSGGINNAAIGGNFGITGNVNIYGGVIDANATISAAIIGGSNYSGSAPCCVKIYGGKITVTNNGTYGSCIGGRKQSSVYIYGGIINATTRGRDAAVIGGCCSSGTVDINIYGGTIITPKRVASAHDIGKAAGESATVKIYGGNITANSTYVTNPTNANDVSVSQVVITLAGAADGTDVTELEGITYGIYDVKTIGDKLYLYLPAGTMPTSITAGGKCYACYRDGVFFQHSWVDATCVRAKHCTICGETEGDVPTHSYENGVCTVCGIDTNGTFHIKTPAQLVAFALYVKDGHKDTSAVLEDNIDMDGVAWTPICQTVSFHDTAATDTGYSGTFDGNGHTISNLTVTGISGGTYSYGLFGTVSGTVKDLGMVNYTYTMGSAPDARAGSIAGQVISGGTITNCYSVGHTITATEKIAGGIAGCNYGGIISDCYAISSSIGESITGFGDRWGGIVGDCQKDNGTFGGTVSNCYTNDTRVVSSQSGNATITNCAVKDDDAFASGEITYLLNGSSSGNVTWYQTLGTDAYPVFDSEHGTVYSVFKCDEETQVYRNVNENEPHTDVDPVDSVCDECSANLHTHEWTYTANDDTITAVCGAADCPLNGAAKTIVISASDKNYDGTAVVATVENNVDGTDYSSSIVYKDNTGTKVDGAVNVGIYTANLTLTNEDSTEVTASVEFTIAPKTLEIGCVTARDRAFDGTNKVEVSEVIISGILNTDNVSVSATATIDSINVGEYSTVDLSGITLTGDAASNYSIVASAEDVDLVPTVTISKAAAPTLSRGSKAYVYNQSYEGEFVSITGVPTDCGEVGYVLLSVSGDMLENISVDRSSGKITYDVKALDSYTEDLQGTIDVNVEMENYETAFYALDVTRRDKYAVTVKDGMSVSLETNELIYGQSLGELAFNEVTFVGETGEEVTGTLKWEDSNKVPDVATDKASWRFIPESDVYKEVVGTLDITVKQAPLVVEAVPVVADRVYNPSVTLADVALSGGMVKDAYGDTIEGTWSWEDSDTVPTVVNDGYEAVFTPVDVNYETVTTTIMVTVAKATPDIGTVSVLDAELENTTDISTVVLKRTDESMAGTLELTAEALLYGAHGYVWKFTPQDLNNYEVLTGTVAIEVKDTIAPVASYKIGTGDWESFGTSTTYETFSKEELSVEIKAEDSGSGIASVQYYMAFGVIPDVSDIPGWTDYTEAITLDIDRTYVIYVKVTDKGGNEVILNSEGIVIYEDSEITTPELTHTYKEEADEEAVLNLNANTFAKITDAEGTELEEDRDYIVTKDSGTLSIEMQSEYLATLDAGEHTYYVSVNPQGVETTAVTLAYSFVVKVTAKELTVTGATATSRAYIANDKTVDITGITLSGIQGTDDVSVNLAGVKGTLSSDNAGTYTSLTLPELTLTGADKGNYELVQPTGPVTVWVRIEKLNAEIIVEYLSHGKIFGEPPFSLGVSDNNPEAEVTYESNNEDVATVTSEGIVTIHKAGLALITVSLAESTNYNSADRKQIAVEVAKKDGYTVDTIQRNYLYSRENADTIDLSAYLPADCGSVSYEISSISDTNNMLENVSVDATGKLTYDVKSLNAYSNGLSATVTVTVSMQNYEDLTYTLTVVRTDKLVQNISAENISLTFGDNDTDIVVTGNKTELSYRVVDDSNENGDVVTVDSTGKVHIVNSGTATVEIKAEGSSSYAEAICEIQVTVAKRTVNVPAKDDTVYTYTALPQTYSIASSPFYTIENTTQTNAGTYDVAVSLISDNYQWSAVLPEYKFVIKPAQVTITAESHTVKQGEELPTFTYTTTGLVNGEALPITVSAACIVSDTDTVGTYDIILSGPASEGNYAYSYQKGVLEVLADDEAPFIMGDEDKMGWDVVSDVIDNAGKGDTVIVDMNGSTVVPGDIIEDARDKDITISFVLDNGLTWTIDGSTVTDGDIDNINFNTTVEDESNPLNNIPVDVINNVTGEKATIEVNLTYSGTLGFTAVLTANLGSDNAGYYANLYYYNPITGQLEYMCADMIASNGEVKLTFTHASDYLVVIDDEDLGKKVPDGDTDDDDEDDDADTTEDKDDGKDEVPDTGDAGTFYLWVIMLCAILGMAGVTCYERVAWKRNEKE